MEITKKKGNIFKIFAFDSALGVAKVWPYTNSVRISLKKKPFGMNCVQPNKPSNF